MLSFKTPTGRVMTSIIWGLGIAALFYLACVKGSLFVVKVPEGFNNDTYQYNDNCYQFHPYPVKCDGKAGAEGFTPEIRGECNSYRYHNIPSAELPLSEGMELSKPVFTGFESPVEFDRASPECKNCNKFEDPHCLWNEHIKAKNCLDPRNNRAPGCYKHHPMDSIFR